MITPREIIRLCWRITERQRRLARKSRSKITNPVIYFDVEEKLISAVIMYIFIDYSDGKTCLTFNIVSLNRDIKSRQNGEWPANQPNCLFTLWVEDPFPEGADVNRYIEKNTLYDFSLDIA
jgi:hypothetical protein